MVYTVSNIASNSCIIFCCLYLCYVDNWLLALNQGAGRFFKTKVLANKSIHATAQARFLAQDLALIEGTFCGA